MGRHLHLAATVFTCLGAQRVAFFRFRECLVVVAEFRGGLCILGSRFSRAEGAWMERQGSDFRGRHLFAFTGRLVAAELKGRHFL